MASTKIPSKSRAVRGCQAESAEAWEELANELAKQNDQDKAKLLLRALAAEMKAQTQAAEMKAQTQAAEMKAQTQAAEMKAQILAAEMKAQIQAAEMKALKKDLMAIRGELTARALIELFVDEVKQEENASGTTTSILRDLSTFSGDSVQFLNKAVQNCLPAGTIPGLFLKETFRQLSGQVHHPRWYGPGIQASRSLNDAQKCVLDKLAEKEGFLLIEEDDPEDSSDMEEVIK